MGCTERKRATGRARHFRAALFVLAAVGLLSPTGAFGYGFQAKWGGPGSGAGQFSLPSGLAVDGLDNVYVADFGNNRIQKFGPDGELLLTFGSAGQADGQFDRPSDVAVDSSGNLYVADYGNDRIQKFTPGGLFVRKWGATGAGPGNFQFPVSLALDAADSVYVADFGNDRIQKFTSDGGFLLTWGSHGVADGQFDGPNGVAVDSLGTVFVTDNGHDRVETFSASTGLFLGKWGTTGSGGGTQLSHPIGITVNSLGSVFVTDAGNNRIKQFTSAGTFIAPDIGSFGSGDGQMVVPSGVATGSLDTVFVSDSLNNRVERFGATIAGSTVRTSGTKLIFDADAGKPNQVTLSASGSPTVFTFADSSDTLTPGAGCQTVDTHSATCGSSGIGSLRVTVEDMNDSVTNNTSTPMVVDGGPGDDSLTGGPGNDTLTGGAGNDTLTSGGGTDIADYSTAPSAVTVSLVPAGAQNTVGAGLDTLSAIRGLTGSSQDDILTGNGSANVLDGGPGDDSIVDGLGNDTVSGGTGTDTLNYSGAAGPVTVDLSSSGAQTTGVGSDTLAGLENLIGSPQGDTLTGDAGPNLFRGAAGDDRLDGAGGSDTADYSTAPSGVTVDLSTTSPQDTQGAGVDALTSIENLTGSSQDDVLTGSAAVNVLSGGNGNDTLTLRDSVADQAFCGSGTDTVEADPLDSAALDCEQVHSLALVTQPGGGGGSVPQPVSSGPDHTAPQLSPLSAGKLKSGVPGSIGYTLTEPATVTFTLEGAKLGRKVRRRCVRQTRKNRKRKVCRFYAKVATLTQSGGNGSNTLRLPAKVAGKALPPGPYRVTAVARDSSGNTSKPMISYIAVLR